MEMWKDIEGYEGIYAVSNYGNVKSLRRNAMLKKRLTHDGYVKVTLTVNYKAHDMRVHRLVANAFVPNDDPNTKTTVNHIDGNKENNRYDNLEWTDRREQMLHAYRAGLKKPMSAECNPQHKLSEDDVRFIRGHYKKGSREYNTVTLGEMFGVTNRVIGLIVNGKAYKTVK